MRERSVVTALAAPSAGAPSTPGRAATGVHLVTLATALALWLFLDRHLWFYGDEWDFLTRRGVLHAAVSIWVPHNEHWSTLPILLWRAIYSLVHLRSYWPYLVPTLLAHLAVVHLLWRRLLREEVGTWLSTGLAAIMAFLGSGAENLAWAFQIGFVAALAFGLAALQLADRARPTLRSDMVASVSALCALMCSSIGVCTTLALAVLMACRRPWRHTVRVLALPVASYAVWFALVGRTGPGSTGDYVNRGVLTDLPDYVWSKLTGGLGSAVDLRVLGPVLGVLLAAWVLWRFGALRRGHPAVLGLVAATVLFYVLAGLARDRLDFSGTPSRYVYIATAMLLPAFGLLLRSVVASRYLRPAVAVLLLLVFAGNLVTGVNFTRSRTVYVQALRQQILGTAELLASGAVPISRYPIHGSGYAAGYLTPTVLVRLERSGLLPKIRLTPPDRLIDQTVLDVVLGPRPLGAGDFTLLGLSRVRPGRAARGCATLVPTRSRGRPQVVLGLARGVRAASLWMVGPPRQQLDAILGPHHDPPFREWPDIGRDPGRGAEYLSDAATGKELILTLPRSHRTTICDVVGAGRYS